MKILYLPNSKCQQRQFEKPDFVAYPVKLAMEAQFYKKKGADVQWGCGTVLPDSYYSQVIREPDNLPFLSLPHPDRIWTKALDPMYQKNGNFKYHPGTYIQSASGCWWGKCSFCIENGQKYEVRPVDDVISEIEECKALGFKEVFDDSATFPQGEWFDRFCDSLSRINGIRFSCNMRLHDCDFSKFRKAGGRMVLFGLESANQKTLDKIGKGIKVEDIKYIIKASEAGLEPHTCVVFGWEWETDSEAINTLKLVHWLLRKGYTKTAQASFISQQNIKGNESQRHFIRNIYGVWTSPEFWFSKIKDIKNIDDLKYLWRQIKEGLKR